MKKLLLLTIAISGLTFGQVSSPTQGTPASGGVAGSTGVGGLAASGSAIAGNPVIIGGRTGAGNAQVVFVEPTSGSFNNWFPIAGADGIANASLAQGLGNNSAIVPEFAPLQFNGASWDRQVYCGATTPTVINPSTATTTLILAAASAQKNRICSIEVSNLTAAQTVKIVAGTQVTNPCDTGQVALTSTLQLGAAQTVFLGGNQFPFVQNTVANQQICAVTSAATLVSIAVHSVTY